MAPPPVNKIKMAIVCFLLSLPVQLVASKIEEVFGLRVIRVSVAMSGVWQVTDVLINQVDIALMQGVSDKYLVAGSRVRWEEFLHWQQIL